MSWTVLVPVKALPAAKSRLAVGRDAAAHARLVTAIRRDTLVAARAAGGVERVLLVADRPELLGGLLHPSDDADTSTDTDTDLFVQATTGLNAALVEAAAHAAAHWPRSGVAALLGDLPALRPAELADTLSAAARVPAGFVRDADGAGTTLLTAAAGVTLAPRFGAGSAARHAAVALELPAGPGLRRDVDTRADLQAAQALGLGSYTTRELAAGAGAGPGRRDDRSPRHGIVGA